jgi:hypothetical protein
MIKLRKPHLEILYLKNMKIFLKDLFRGHLFLQQNMGNIIVIIRSTTMSRSSLLLLSEFCLYTCPDVSSEDSILPFCIFTPKEKITRPSTKRLVDDDEDKKIKRKLMELDDIIDLIPQKDKGNVTTVSHPENNTFFFYCN